MRKLPALSLMAAIAALGGSADFAPVPYTESRFINDSVRPAKTGGRKNQRAAQKNKNRKKSARK